MEAVPDTVIVFTTDMEGLAAFYRKGLGLGEPETGPRHMGFALPNLYLGFDQVDEAYAAPAAVTLWFRVDDLEATYLRLLELGATSKYGPVDKPWGERLAAVFDPDGNVVGLARRRD